MSFYDVISERLAALTGSSSAVEARDALNEFNVRDIQAVSVSEGGGGGGSQPFALLGPFDVAHDAAGFMNPGDNGIETLAIPTGTVLLKAFAVVTAAFTGADGADNIVLTLGATSSGGGPTLASYIANNWRDPDVGVDVSEGKNQVAFEAVYGGVASVAVGGCHIYAAYFPNATPPSAGSIAVYAHTYTPS